MARRPLHNLIQSAVKTVPVEQSFLTDLEYTVTKMDAAKGRTPSKSYKPSSLKCIRNMYYQRIGQPQDPSSTSAAFVGLCEVGSFRHDVIQEAVCHMKDYGIDCEYLDVGKYVEDNNLDYLEIKHKQGHETKLWHKHLNMSFLCDGIIRYKGELFVLEIKTETIYKWQGRKAMALEHEEQACAYSLSFGINKVLFLYENRDVCGKKTFVYNVPEAKVEEVVSKIETCEGYVNRMIVPPKPDVDRKVCNYCNYKSQCKKDGK